MEASSSQSTVMLVALVAVLYTIFPVPPAPPVSDQLIRHFGVDENVPETNVSVHAPPEMFVDDEIQGVPS